MIKRSLAVGIKEASNKYPVVAILGPRQSGKTTLVKEVFPNKPYVSLEQLDIRQYAESDPNGFLADYPNGAILDEVQRVPDLFSYIQGIVDEKKTDGLFILTGSQNFALVESINQSLAGRIALFRLLPFSIEELSRAGQLPASLNDFMFKGGYPRIYDKLLNPTQWLDSYIQTYVERDVRLLKNIGDLSVFSRFVKMCAARTGQLINLSSLGSDCGVSYNTVRAWLSILEASYLVFLLQPHHRNFNKRLVKSPKLYFYDTGLLCFLLGIKQGEELAIHALRGGIFESFVISEMKKNSTYRGQYAQLFFWRDKSGHEIYCIAEKANELIPIEIKAGQTIPADYLKNIEYWKKLSNSRSRAYLVYAGDKNQKRSGIDVVRWNDIPTLPF